MNKTKHPHDLLELGKKYPALKKEYDELKILCDQAVAQRFLAEIARDKCIEVLKEVLNYEKRCAQKGNPAIGNGILSIIHKAINQTLAKINPDGKMEKLYGKTHTYKRVYGNLSPDITKLKNNQSVCWGDGKTFYYLLTDKPKTKAKSNG